MSQLLQQSLSISLISSSLVSIISVNPLQAEPSLFSRVLAQSESKNIHNFNNLISCSPFKGSLTQSEQQGNTIVDIAVTNPSFSTLVKALEAAGLIETLSGENFTVFAPTNEAFDALTSEALEKLLLPENREILRKILTYHVVSGSVRSTALKNGQVKTIEGNDVNVEVDDRMVSVNGTEVINADIQASNGIIHVIGRVLIPPDLISTPQPRSYIGVGGAIGLSGDTTALSSGGASFLTKSVLSENLALHTATVLFGSNISSSSLALTLNLPIREESANQITVIPFLGGGVALRNADGLTVSPMVSGGLDIPLSKDFTGTVRVNAIFPSDRQADVGILAGIGFNFSLF
ncbi:MAG: hypothetical protein DCE90_03580 [Pseudanabaena sp.]|nr:MAG: hypothetical protein DCE90_03580 [Pseudanabaena sp.]